jgi:hypothetical protein
VDRLPEPKMQHKFIQKKSLKFYRLQRNVIFYNKRHNLDNAKELSTNHILVHYCYFSICITFQKLFELSLVGLTLVVLVSISFRLVFRFPLLLALLFRFLFILSIDFGLAKVLMLELLEYGIIIESEKEGAICKFLDISGAAGFCLGYTGFFNSMSTVLLNSMIGVWGV